MPAATGRPCHAPGAPSPAADAHDAALLRAFRAEESARRRSVDAAAPDARRPPRCPDHAYPLVTGPCPICRREYEARLAARLGRRPRTGDAPMTIPEMPR